MPIFINETSKYYLSELERVGNKLVICKDWPDFANNYKKNGAFALFPVQAENNTIWGIVWQEFQVSEVLWFTASPENSMRYERQSIDKLVKQYCGSGASLKPDADAQSQSQRTNTDFTLIFSEAFASFMTNKIIELQYNWNVAKTSGNSWDNIKFPKGVIESYKRGEYQISIETNKYKDLFDYWNSNGFRDLLDNNPLSLDGLKLAKTRLEQWKTWTNTFTVKDYPNGAGDVNAKITTLSNNQETHKPEDLKPADYDDIKKKLTDWQTNFPNQEPSQVKNQAEQGSKGKDSIIKNQEDFITQRDNTIKAQEGEITKKIDTISELNKENQSLKDQIQALKDQSDLQAVQEVGVSDK